LSFSAENIKKHTKDNKTFLLGKSYYEAGNVSDIQVNTFWKTESSVNGVISSDGQKNRSRISLENGNIIGFGCTCADFRDCKGACAHIVALAFKCEENMKNEAVGVVYTSHEARKMVNCYMNKANVVEHAESEVGGMTETKQAGDVKIQLEPNINIGKDINGYTILRVSFYLKRLNSRHLIRDLYHFAQCVNENKYFEYGKRLAFVHNVNAFDEKMIKLAEFLVKQTEQARTCSIISENRGEFIENSRDLLLFGSSIDTFFEIIKNIGMELLFDKDKHVRIVDERPALRVNVTEKGTMGYELSVEGVDKIIITTDRLYVISENKLHVCGEKYAEDMGDFLKNMCNAGKKVELNKNDMAPFYNMVMHVVERYAVVDYGKINTDEFTPWTLNTTFYLDIDDNDAVGIKTECYYNEVPFDMNTGRVAAVSVNRDYFAENKIRTVIERYFGSLGEDGYKTGDYDKIFRILSEGVDELSHFGRVKISERLKAFKLIPAVQVIAGVRVEGDILHMNIDLGEYGIDELRHVLEAYKEKKKYIKLGDKGLLKMEDSGMELIAQFMDEMEFSVEDIFNGTIFIPRYRCLYLDRSLKADSGIKYDKDEAFRCLARAVKNAGDNEYTIPKVLSGVLRGYQETGYNWLRALDECGFGGILADDMGLGKTIQVIALLEHFRADGVSLVVAPSSLIYNWENEIMRFAPMIKCAAVVGGKSERREILEKSKDYDVLITSYELLKRDIDMYKNMTFRFHIIDEAQYIKNQNTENARVVKKIKSKTRFALTGTPIENRLSELWSIFDFIMPGSLYSYRKFRETFELPIALGDKKASDRLKNIVGPFIMRRMKKDVLKELPDKLEYEVYAKLEGEQHKLYLANAMKLRKELLESDDNYYKDNRIQIFAQLTRLRQICCEPSLCYENYDDESAKLQMCIDMVKNGIDGGHKILLFSQFTSMLEIIRQRFEEEGIKYYLLTGKTKKENRQNMVENFNIDDTSVFLISLKAGGTGLNLTAADMVIHYDPWWNRAAELQAADRTHRIGQKNVVSVFRLIAKDTIEEYIIGMQNNKIKLAEDILSNDNEGIVSLTKEELIRLLE